MTDDATDNREVKETVYAKVSRIIAIANIYYETKLIVVFMVF